MREMLSVIHTEEANFSPVCDHAKVHRALRVDGMLCVALRAQEDAGAQVMLAFDCQ